MLALTLRIDRGGVRWLGSGKIRLLELTAEHGSIEASGRAMGMSYRRAWLLVNAMSTRLGEAVVQAPPGGAGGGAAVLAQARGRLVVCYRELERVAIAAAQVPIATLHAMIAR